MGLLNIIGNTISSRVSSGGGTPGTGVEWQWEDEENLQWEDDSTIDTEE